MAMIPFLRGYIHIMNDPEDLYGQLSRLMHGFENGSLDIADVYKKTFGYEVEPFGGKEFAITAIPADFEAVDMKGMFLDMLDDFTNISGREAPELILEKVASMSCKAAIKGGDSISRAEAEQLIDELLSLENPYHCPHGRPTIISMSKYEIEKKFKRIV